MPRKVKRGSGCSGSPRKSRRVKKNSGKSVKKSVYSCGSRKRRQTRSMRGGYNEAALQKVLDAALRGDADLSGGAYGSGSSGLGGSRLNGGQGGGSRRLRTKRARRARRSRRSMRGGVLDVDGMEITETRQGFGDADPEETKKRVNDLNFGEFTFGGTSTGQK